MLAPIGLTVYGRLSHVKMTVEALQQNYLAQDSELFIFSDAPKPGDEDKVAKMRTYIRTIGGFKNVVIIERDENSRLNNNRGGQKYLLEHYGRMIWLAEDVVTAPGFLAFVNEALDYYRDNPRIGSITGYCPPIDLPEGYNRDFFTLTAINCWGFGLWQRYYRMDTPVSDSAYAKAYGARSLKKRFEHEVGEATAHYLQMDYEGRANAGDIRSSFWQFLDGKLTVYPRKSLVRSIGQDNSGLHMGRTDKWDVKELWDKTQGFVFSDDIEVEDSIRDAHNRFYRINKAKLNLIRHLDKVGIYQYLKPVAQAIRNRKNNHV
jgi:hypothetical protein